MGVGRGDTDDDGQRVRVRQDVHLGTRLAPVHGTRTCEVAPLFSPSRGRSPGPPGRDRGGRRRRGGAGSPRAADPRLRPSTRSGTCGEPSTSISRSTAAAPARRAPADQDINDRGEQRLIRRVLRPATLRPHLRRRNQRPRDLPQPVRNNPTPPTPPHTDTNDASPHRTRSWWMFCALKFGLTASRISPRSSVGSCIPDGTRSPRPA